MHLPLAITGPVGSQVLVLSPSPTTLAIGASLSVHITGVTTANDVGSSLGISVVEAGSASDSEELIRNADAAMYIAKSDGKGGYRVFEPAMHERVVARLALRADLQRALEREEFVLHYQPLVRLEDGAMTGVEYIPYHVCSSKTVTHRIYRDADRPSHLLRPIIPGRSTSRSTSRSAGSSTPC